MRIGNAAQSQFQLDIYGELMDALHAARKYRVEPAARGVARPGVLLRSSPSSLDASRTSGIWEVRGPRAALHPLQADGLGRRRPGRLAVEQHGQEGPVEEWRALRARIHDDVCRRGYDPGRKQLRADTTAARRLDASLLLMPIVGFLPPDDPRVVGTVEAIRRELAVDGFVLRYRTGRPVDGLPAGEGAFLPCTFWLADCLALMGRRDEAAEIFERLLGIRNDVGLLAEEYDPRARRQLGNFPQAFSHVGLINTAQNLALAKGPAEERQR